MQTSSKSEVFRSPASTAPLTSLALSPPLAKSPTTLFAASWDETIHSWDLATRKPSRRLTGGHLDFIKCLISVNLKGEDLLISGSADATIVVWDVSSGVKLQVLRGGHSRGILDLAIDPLSPYFTGEPQYTQDVNGQQKEVEGGITIFSASSDRTLRRLALTIRLDRPHLEETHPDDPLIRHETSVYALHFDGDGDLWTASADGTAKCLSHERGWEPDTEIQHGDYVRAVVIDDIGGYIVTAGRSEDIKVWEKGSGKLVHRYEGHFDEITAMVLLPQRREVVTVGIDASIRRWSLKAQDLEKAKSDAEEEVARRERGEEAVDEEAAADGDGKGGKGKGALTEEEEKELNELMGDSE